LKFLAVSTFNRAGLDLYGRRMLASFHQEWPKEAAMRVYSEGWDCFDAWGPAVADLAGTSPWLAAFKSRNADRTFKDFRWDGVRFAHKVAAVCHAARQTDVDVLIWLDGDIFTHAPVTMTDLEALAPAGDEWISWLDRTAMYPECGFYMLNCRHENHLRFIAAFEAMYATDALYDLAEYHDSFVLQQVVAREGAVTKSLSGAGRSTSHPLVNGPLGQWFDHLKGPRKREGRSRPGDLKVSRQEGYWR